MSMVTYFFNLFMVIQQFVPVLNMRTTRGQGINQFLLLSFAYIIQGR